MKEKGQIPPKTITKNSSKFPEENYLYYNSLKTAGVDYIDRERRRIARNIIYLAYQNNIPVSRIVYFYDMFRGVVKPSLIAVINLCNSFECFDMNSIFYGDLITEAIQSGTLLHGFNPETYRMPSDTW